MKSYCHSYTDSEIKYLSSSPLSAKGTEFVLNLFKSSAKPVLVTDHTGFKIMISAKGFTATWNKKGQDAL